MENKRQLSLGARAGGLSFSAVVVINLIITLFASIIIKVTNSAQTDAVKYVSCLISPVAVLIVFTLAVKVTGQPARQLVPLRSKPKYYLIGLLLAFGLFFSLSWVNDLLVQLFELFGYQRRESFLPDFSGWKIVPVMLVVAVIPAIMEEIMFRGILLKNIEEGVGSVRAIFICGFCFSLYHGSVEQTVYQFICGCLYAFLVIRCRAVTPAVIIHFLNNAVIILLYWCGAVDMQSGAIIMSKAVEITLYVLSALSLVGAVVWLILDKTEIKKCQSGAVKEFFLCAAVGIGAMAIMWISGLFA